MYMKCQLKTYLIRKTAAFDSILETSHLENVVMQKAISFLCPKTWEAFLSLCISIRGYSSCVDIFAQDSFPAISK